MFDSVGPGQKLVLGQNSSESNQLNRLTNLNCSIEKKHKKTKQFLDMEYFALYRNQCSNLQNKQTYYRFQINYMKVKLNHELFLVITFKIKYIWATLVLMSQ